MVIPWTCIREKKWYSISEDSPQREWDRMAEKMMVTLAEGGHPQSFEPRAHCPEECSKAKAVEICRSTIVPTQETITTVFRTITSVIQLSLYGAVADTCEEYESFLSRWYGETRTGRTVKFLVCAKCDQDKRAFE